MHYNAAIGDRRCGHRHRSERTAANCTQLCNNPSVVQVIGDGPHPLERVTMHGKLGNVVRIVCAESYWATYEMGGADDTPAGYR